MKKAPTVPKTKQATIASTPTATKPVAKAARQPKETAAPKATKATRPAQARKWAKPVDSKPNTKGFTIQMLISQKNGATLEEIMEATGWQKHSVRGFISILGKAGTKIESSKSDAGARTYKAA